MLGPGAETLGDGCDAELHSWWRRGLTRQGQGQDVVAVGDLGGGDRSRGAMIDASNGRRPVGVGYGAGAGSRRHPWVARLVVVGVASASFVLPIRPSTADEVAPSTSTTPCEDPDPCGPIWPDGVRPPFAAEPEVRRVEITRPDGVVLRGWYRLPAVPSGVRVPVLVTSTPYFSPFDTGGVTPDRAEWWSESVTGKPVDDHWGVPPIELVRQGYATVFFAARGTATSGGCFDPGGTVEQGDQIAMVEWAASQPWSNGRVARGGSSYSSWTALQAAVQVPKALKTIVVTATAVDAYRVLFSPQGAAKTLWHTYPSAYPATTAPSSVWDPAGNVALSERRCDETIEAIKAANGGWATGDRVPSYWAERRLSDRLPAVKAAVLLASGLRDQPATVDQDTWLWQSLRRAPKRAVHGYWGHEFPDKAKDAASTGYDWGDDLLFPWLDYWLKGLGPRPATGVVDYEVAQDVRVNWEFVSPLRLRQGRMIRTTAWPPPEARQEALYLAGSSLRTAPTAAAPRDFLAAPDPFGEYTIVEDEEPREFTTGEDVDGDGQDSGVSYNLWPALCPTGVGLPGVAPGGLAYLSQPLDRDVVLAGNPFLHVDLVSNMPGGLIGASLISVSKDFSCTDTERRGVHVMAAGAADLRFRASEDYRGVDFPVGARESVRIDLWDLAEAVPAGNRIGVVLGYGSGGLYSSGQPYAPTISVHSAGEPGPSQVVLPVVEGSLGGAAPITEFAPVPFVPVRGE